ncbi:hypothetical protein [Halobaculum sp. CBA1158]|nr:hypothetical protein [Halobaculum sp. CBA1158]
MRGRLDRDRSGSEIGSSRELNCPGEVFHEDIWDEIPTDRLQYTD